jgi:hypothetical protein
MLKNITLFRYTVLYYRNHIAQAIRLLVNRCGIKSTTCEKASGENGSRPLQFYLGLVTPSGVAGVVSAMLTH